MCLKPVHPKYTDKIFLRFYMPVLVANWNVIGASFTD